MRITQVEYRRLKTGAGYNNETVGAVALLGERDTPNDTLAVLKEWVDAQFVQKETLESRFYDLEHEVRRTEADLDLYKRKIEAATRRWEIVKGILTAHGVDTTDIENDDSHFSLANMPF